MKNCRWCNKIIIVRYNQFCNQSCNAFYYANQRRLNPKPIRQYLKNCKWCGKEFDNKNNQFCNNSCAASYTNKQRPPMSEEQKRKISIAVKKKYIDNPELSKQIKRNPRPRKPKKLHQLICKVCNNNFSHEYSKKVTCSKECLYRDRGTRAWQLGNVDGWGHQGWYRGIKCDSTYELAFIIWCLDHQIEVKRCKLRIPYFYHGNTHYYSPDFEINEEIVEIKGYINERAQLKLDSATNQGYKITLIGQQKIKKYLEYIKKKYNLNIERDYAKFYTTKT